MHRELPAIFLHLQVALRRRKPVAVAAVFVAFAGAFLLASFSAQRTKQRQVYRVKIAEAKRPVAAIHAVDPDAENREAFYAVLGERRYAEEQVRMLFGLADKAGLSLNQGRYQQAYDSHARVHTYQITLPVKGSYTAVRQFAMMALEAIPFASLDEISFQRDSVGNPNIEARLQFTLFLSEDKR